MQIVVSLEAIVRPFRYRTRLLPASIVFVEPRQVQERTQAVLSILIAHPEFAIGTLINVQHPAVPTQIAQGTRYVQCMTLMSRPRIL